MNETEKLLKDLSERIDRILEEVSEMDNEIYVLQMQFASEHNDRHPETDAFSMKSEDSQ